MKEFLEHRPTEALLIPTDKMNNNKTYCFSTRNGPFGWCATCKVGHPSNCGIIFKFEIGQLGAKKGERGFCPQNKNIDPKNPDEVAWPNATEVLHIIL